MDHHAPRPYKIATPPLSRIVHELTRRTYNRRGIIPFPEVNRVLGPVFHANKEARQEILFELRQQGLIEVVPFRGIKILGNSDGTR